MKFTKRYLNGFREGFNNPSQYNEKILTSNDEYIKGIIAGYCKRKQRIQEGKNYFIWNEKELLIEQEED
jgi:ribosomal protein S17E